MRLHFGCAPGKLDLGLHLIAAEVFLGKVDNFGRNSFSLQIFDRFNARIFGHRQNPAGGLAGYFAELEFADFMDLRAVLLNPVVAGDAAVQIAMLDVAADFLRPNHSDFQFFIVHVGNVGAAADGNVEAGLAHLFDGGILQTALGQSEA